MATISGYINPNNAYRLTLTVTESNIDAYNNRSDVTVVGTLSRANQYYSAHMPNATISVTIGGTTYNYTLDVSIDNSSTSVQLFSRTVSVTHSSDGTFSLWLSLSFNGNVSSTYNPNGTVSGWVELTAIPRGSIPSVNPQTVTVNGTNAVTIATNRRATTYTHTLTATVGGTVYQIAQNVGAEATWVVPTSVIKKFPSTSNTAECTITCVTYTGDGDELGTASCTLTLVADAAVAKPTVSVASIVERNTETYPGGTLASIEGTHLVHGYSIPYVTVNTGSAWGASVVSVSIDNGEAVYTGEAVSGGFAVLMSEGPGTGEWVITATDSRGISTTVTHTVTVDQYRPLSLWTTDVSRPSPDLDRVDVYISGTYTQSLGDNGNSLTTDWRYTPKGGTETDAGSFAVNESANAFVSDWYTNVLDRNTIYNATFTLTDKLSTVSFSVPVYKATPVMSFGTNGRLGQDNHMDVFGDLILHSEEDPSVYAKLDYDWLKTVLGTIFPVGAVYLTTATTDLSHWLGFEWEQVDEGYYLMSASAWDDTSPTYPAGSEDGYIPKLSGSEATGTLGLTPSNASFSGRIVVSDGETNVSDYRPRYFAVNVWRRTA